MTAYLSDAALPLKVHLVICTLQKSQLIKKDDIRSALFQFCSTCPILKLNYLQRVKQVLTLLAPSTFLSKHPGR